MAAVARRETPLPAAQTAAQSAHDANARNARRATSCRPGGSSCKPRLPFEVPDDEWHLDACTKQIGRSGLAQARAALTASACGPVSRERAAGR